MLKHSDPLFEYQSDILGSHTTFYFRPLSGTEQELYRKSYPQFESTYEMMREIFCSQIELYQIHPFEDFYLWPEDPMSQDDLLTVIPENGIIEVGAAILGWIKLPDEDDSQFIDRIVGDLRESLHVGNR